MRTYTVRDVRGAGVDTRLVVDLVLHLDDGATGPGSRWAAAARPGDRLVLVGAAPRRGVRRHRVRPRHRPQPAAGRPTRPPSRRSAAILERPAADGARRGVPRGAARRRTSSTSPRPPGVEVVWLPARRRAARGAAARGGASPTSGAGADRRGRGRSEVDPDLWETPTYSSSGEELDAAR